MRLRPYTVGKIHVHVEHFTRRQDINQSLVLTIHVVYVWNPICTVDDFVLKNYLEFHDDLFPDTASDEPGLSASAWFSGANGQVMVECRVLLLPWLH